MANLGRIMNILIRLLNQYCQLFGYSSCNNLRLMEKFLLSVVAVFVLLVIFGILKKIATGVSK